MHDHASTLERVRNFDTTEWTNITNNQLAVRAMQMNFFYKLTKEVYCHMSVIVRRANNIKMQCHEPQLFTNKMLFDEW